MQWEIILALILAIGVGITIKEAFVRRSMHKTRKKRMLSNQHSLDENKKNLFDRKM
jgi:hypothetical protein